MTNEVSRDERNARALATLASFREGDAVEQAETLAVLRAALEPEMLDVERLAAAMSTWPGRLDVGGDRLGFVSHVAAEYDRLTRKRLDR